MHKHRLKMITHNNRLNTITNEGGVQIIHINNTTYNINIVNTIQPDSKHKEDK